MESVALFKQAMYLVVLLSAPTLLVVVVIGVLISLIQALMQLQDQALPFALKLIAAGLVLAMTSRWMGSEMMKLTYLAFDLMAQSGVP